MADRPRSAANGSAIAVAVGLLVVVLAFATYLTQMQRSVNAQVERQRRATCALLAATPRGAFAGLAAMRAAFARPGHPHDCQPAAHPTIRPTPNPASTATRTVVVAPGPTVVKSPRPRVHSTRPAARPTRTPAPSSSPSPTPTCVLFICVR